MSKIQDYIEELKKLKYWDEYLMKNSNLPSPRSNLELLAAAVELGNKETFLKFLKITPEIAGVNDPGEFLCTIGVAGLGKIIAEEKSSTHLFVNLCDFARDPRWRVREGVAMALQYIGKKDMHFLFQSTSEWAQSDLFVQRALVAGLCEPALLRNSEDALKVLEIVFRITENLKKHNSERKTEAYRVLKKALSYGLSVAIVFSSEKGKQYFENLMNEKDPDIRSILKENLSKQRLIRMDSVWVNSMLTQF